MKKKLLSLLLALALVLSNTTVAFAAEALTEPKEMENAIPSATGAEAVAAVSASDSVVIDLRAAADYEAAHIKGSISLPVCLSDYSVTTDQRDNFVSYVKENISSDTKIYLVCYMGTFCVNYAAKWLTDPVDANGCGFATTNLYRVTGGIWQDDDLAAACNSTHYDVALASDGIILDVRATSTYLQGYVDKSLHQPLFDDNGVTNGSDKLATDFTAFVNANYDFLASKNIFVLCNSGSRGAVNATTLLNAAGITNVFTIENGAKSDIKNVFVTNNSVTGAKAVEDAASDSVVILDVRTTEKYVAGHIAGSISMPVFSTAGVTNCYDDLAKAFLASVQANKAALEGKQIYILCNSGSRGAQAATRLLMQAGYSTANIFTITGGAGNEDIKNILIKENIGWQENSTGWWYLEADGSWPASTWKLIDGEWFYFNAKGYRVTGWQKVNNVWYFFDEETGVMAANSWIGDYYVSASGAMVTGWVQLDEEWYFFDATGKKTTGWVLSKSGWFYLDTETGVMVTDSWIGDYYVDATGVMKTGWLELDGTWYYLGTTGKKAVDWQKIKGVWYFFDEDGAMLEEGLYDIDGTTYAFNASGAMLTGWQKIEDEWYYFDASGAGYTGWIKSGANWYYCEDGWMVYDCTYYIEKEDKWAEFTADGVWLYYVQWTE